MICHICHMSHVIEVKCHMSHVFSMSRIVRIVYICHMSHTYMTRSYVFVTSVFVWRVLCNMKTMADHDSTITTTDYQAIAVRSSVDHQLTGWFPALGPKKLFPRTWTAKVPSSFHFSQTISTASFVFCFLSWPGQTLQTTLCLGWRGDAGINE